MKKETQDQILTALQEIKSALTELKQSIDALRRVSKEQIINRRENPNTQSKISKNKKARELTIRLLNEGFYYDEIRQMLFRKLNFLTSTSAISRFYRRTSKEN